MSDQKNLETGTDSIGRWMIIAAWGSLIVLLSIIFSNVLEKQQNPNQKLQVNYSKAGVPEVVLKQNRAGHYVASGKINGHSVVFLVDTGATDVAVSKALADKLSLPRGAVFSSRTANGTVKSTQTQLNRVQLGPIEIADVSASILPTMREGEVLLGMSFLRQLELVQRGKNLTLRQYLRGAD